MREYSLIVGDIQTLLNKNGRNKKGYNAQEHFLNLLKELKQDYKMELSTKFLFNLFNSEIPASKKRMKLRNLLRNVETRKEGRFYRGLEVLNYKTEIVEYKHSKKAPFNMPIVEMSEDEQAQINEIKAISEQTGIFLFNIGEENFKERVRRRNAIYKTGVFIADTRTEQVSKEFMISRRENLKFVDL